MCRIANYYKNKIINLFTRKMIQINRPEVIQAQIQNQTASINISNHMSKLDLKGLEFLFHAEFDIIYQSFQMKHAAYLQRKIVDKSKRQQNQEIKRKLQVASQKNHIRIIKHDSKVDRLLNRVQFLWNQKGIPYFHRYYFQKNIDNDMRNYIQNLQFFLTNEQKLIKGETHIIFSLDRVIKARQACIYQFKSYLQSLTQSDIEEHLYTCTERLYYLRSRKQKIEYQIQGYKINKIMDKKVSKNVFQLTKFQIFGSIYQNLLKLTLHVIQLICKWKDYLYSLTPDILKKRQQIDYYFQEQNYLLRIINDNNFLQTSFLANYLKFSQKNDPFLLLPLLQIEKQQNIIAQKATKQARYIEESTGLKCLKRIFAPQNTAQLIEILSKVRMLVTQFQTNIKNRKIFDLKLIHKINNLDLSKSLNKLNKSRSKLNTLNTQQSLQKSRSSLQNSRLSFQNSRISLQKSKNFRVSVQTQQLNMKNVKKQNQMSPIMLTTKSFKQLLIPSKINSLNLISKNPLLKLTNLNQSNKFLERKNSIIKNSSKKQQSSQIQSKIGSRLLNSLQITLLKQSLKQKIKQELKLNDNRTSMRIFENPELKQYIQYEVKKVFLETQFQNSFHKLNVGTKLRNTQARAKFTASLSIQTYSIDESQLPSHINHLVDKQTLLQFQFMQPSKQQLFQGKSQDGRNPIGLQSLPCLYFLNIKQKKSQKNPLQQSQELQQSKIVSSIAFTIKYVQKQSLTNKKHSLVEKIIQILYMTIKSQNYLDIEKVMLKTVDFLFKYETSQSIAFTFYYNQSIQFQKQKISQLKTALQINNCLIAQKLVFKGLKKSKKSLNNQSPLIQKCKITQIKFHFTRKDDSKTEMLLKIQNQFQTLNSSPLSLYVGIYGLLSMEKINLSNLQIQKNSLSQINYDYLLTQILKNHLNSDYFLALRNKALFQHRLRVIIENIMSLKQRQKTQQKLPFIQILEDANIFQLNKKLSSDEKKVWSGVDDLLKLNFIKMFCLELKISLPYHGRAFINSSGNPFFRFQIRQYIQVLNMSYYSSFMNKGSIQNEVLNEKIYLFSCLQKKNILIGFFDAGKIDNFIRKQNEKIVISGQKNSLMTISDLINSLSFIKSENTSRSMKLQSHQTQYVRNLYFPMLKFNTKSNKQSTTQNVIKPLKCQDLSVISKNQSNQLLIGSDILWKFDINLQNGIRYNYEKQKNDLLFDKEYKQDKENNNNNYDLSEHNNQNKQQIQNEKSKSLIGKKMGIVLFLVPEYIVIYSRIF